MADRWATHLAGRRAKVRNVNFKLVHAFVAVAEVRSFRIAAEQLGRSQSGVSVQIRELETQLAIRLFHRTTRQVRLTEAGEKLLDHARRALDQWDVGLRSVREAADLVRGMLLFACVPTVAETRLPAILASYVEDFPGINIQLRELPSGDLLEAVRRQQVDFGIGLRVERETEFEFEFLAADPIYVLGRGKFGLVGRSFFDLAMLEGVPILLNAKSAALRDLLERETAVRGVHLNVKFEVLHTHTAVALAQAGLGVAILPRIALPEKLESDMIALPIVDPPVSRDICIITLRGHSLSPSAGRLREIVKLAFRKDGESTRPRRYGAADEL